MHSYKYMQRLVLFVLLTEIINVAQEIVRVLILCHETILEVVQPYKITFYPRAFHTSKTSQSIILIDQLSWIVEL